MEVQIPFSISILTESESGLLSRVTLYRENVQFQSYETVQYFTMKVSLLFEQMNSNKTVYILFQGDVNCPEAAALAKLFSSLSFSQQNKIKKNSKIMLQDIKNDYSN